MKIAYLSDIHTDIADSYPKFTLDSDTDIFVCVGDISHCVKRSGISTATGSLYKTIEQNEIKCPVIFVPGNHDYYHGEYNHVHKEMRKICAFTKNMIFLDNNYFIMDGVQFIGSTLWTDFGGDPEMEFRAGNSIADFHAIKGFTTERCKGLHNNAKAYIENELRKARHLMTVKPGIPIPDNLITKKLVVCTHFCPTFQCDHPQFPGNEPGSLKRYFHVDMDDLILEYKPDAWIWGHTHFDARFKIGETQMVSSQRGYESSNWAPEKQWRVEYITV